MMQNPIQKPFPQSYWVYNGLLCAGCYPGDLIPSTRDAKLKGLLDCGIRQVISLMEDDEMSRGGHPFAPYISRLHELAAETGVTIRWKSLPIMDASVPTSPSMEEILTTIDAYLDQNIPVYLHCWGGHGRTSTVIACHLIRHGSSPAQAIERVLELRKPLPKNHFPFEEEQELFVRAWLQNI